VNLPLGKNSVKRPRFLREIEKCDAVALGDPQESPRIRDRALGNKSPRIEKTAPFDFGRIEKPQFAALT
jgi:hypothetical protein